MARPAVLTVADTIARSFLKSVETRGDRPAIREKKFGIWQPTSWRAWLQISKDISFGLHASGFRPGDVASIIANAVPEWVFADMGILCAGGVSSGIYPTDSAAQVEYLVNDSRTRVIFAEDEEQLDKILKYSNPSSIDFLVLGGSGRALGASNPDAFQKLKDETFLVKKNKEKIPLQDVQLPSGPGQPIILRFPREVEGKPAVTLEDKEIELVTKMGTGTIRTRFKLAEMVVNGQLEI